MHLFEFVLKNEKRRLYSRFSRFIFILNGLGFLYFFVIRNRPDSNGWVPLLLASLATVCILAYLFFRKKTIQDVAYLVSIVIIPLVWLWIGYWWFALLLGILFLLYAISRRKLKVTIAEDLIIYPSFPLRSIHWNELNNVVIRDGLLTIDFKNNKLIQQLVESFPSDFKEKEFNEFCHKRIQS